MVIVPGYIWVTICLTGETHVTAIGDAEIAHKVPFPHIDCQPRDISAYRQSLLYDDAVQKSGI
jgi:hypothetical protein